MFLPTTDRPSASTDPISASVPVAAPSTRPKYPFNVSKADIATLSFDCNPAYLPAWFSLFMARLPLFSPDAAQLLYMGPQEVRAHASSPDRAVAEKWRSVDTSLASLLLCLMKKEGVYAQNFLAKLSYHPTSLTSGYAIAKYLVDSTVPRTTAEYEEVQARIEKGVYFNLGMSREQTEAAAHELHRDWLSTPAARAPGDHDLIHCLIKKFPSYSLG